MPTYRKLHTKIVESLDVNDMPDDFHRLFWTLLPLALCREGRGLLNGAWLKSRLFPLREDISHEHVRQTFQWFIDHGMVEPYTVSGREYFYVPTFAKYQGATIKEKESDYPPPPDWCPPESLSDDASSPEQVESGSGVGQESVPNRSMTDSEADSEADSDSKADSEAEADAGRARDGPAAAVSAETEELLAELASRPALDMGVVRRKLPTWNRDKLPGWIAATALIDDPELAARILVARMDAGDDPPFTVTDDDRRRFIEGDYAEYIQH